MVVSQANIENLRGFLKDWGREAWTMETVQQRLDPSLLDPDVIYEDTVLPDHVGEAYHGHEGVIRATQRWIEPFEWLVVELKEVLEVGDRLVSIHEARAKARHTGSSSRRPWDISGRSGTAGSFTSSPSRIPSKPSKPPGSLSRSCLL